MRFRYFLFFAMLFCPDVHARSEYRNCCGLISEIRGNVRSYVSVGFIVEHEGNCFLVMYKEAAKLLNNNCRIAITSFDGIDEFVLHEFVKSMEFFSKESFPVAILQVSDKVLDDCKLIAAKLSIDPIIEFPKSLTACSILLSERTKGELPDVFVPVNIIARVSDSRMAYLGDEFYVATNITLPSISPVLEFTSEGSILRGMLADSLISNGVNQRTTVVLSNQMLRKGIEKTRK